MRQTFNSGINDTSSLLKNMYYQVQADYVQRNISNFDPRFMDRVNEYNHVGKFDITTNTFRWPVQAGVRPFLFEATANPDGSVTVTDKQYRSIIRFMSFKTSRMDLPSLRARSIQILL
jgi:hypothetical protein